MRIPCGRASRGQAQAAAPLQRNSAKFVMKSTARHQSIGTGDKPIHSVERAALRPGIALIKGKLSCFFREKKNQRRLKRTCIDFILISLYVKPLEGDRADGVHSLSVSDPSTRVPLGDIVFPVHHVSLDCECDRMVESARLALAWTRRIVS